MTYFCCLKLNQRCKDIFTLLELIKCASSDVGICICRHIITHLNQRLMYGCL